MKTTDKNFDVELAEAEEAFKNAINKHLLSTVWGREDYAGNYMYMYSDNGKDFFKSIATRDYISCEGV
jgi:hypothetical protein